MTEFLFGAPIFVLDCSEEQAHVLEKETANINNQTDRNLSNPWDGNILSTFKSTEANDIIKNCYPNINTHILKSTNLFLKELQVSPNYSFIDIYESWINYASQNMYQEVHSHPYADISGVFYSQVDNNNGDLYFIAPSTSYSHSDLIFRSKILKDNIKIKPVKNRLVLFPSWLQHGTQPNRANSTRVSLSFNIKLTP